MIKRCLLIFFNVKSIKIIISLNELYQYILKNCFSLTKKIHLIEVPNGHVSFEQLRFFINLLITLIHFRNVVSS